MKKDSIIIAALSVGIVLIVAVTAVVLFQNSKKITDQSKSSTSATTITTQTTKVPAAATSATETTPAATTRVTETTQTAVKATPTPTSTSSPTLKPAVEDGSYNAFVAAVSTKAPDSKSQGTISVRIAKIYTGAEAVAQAKADGQPDLIEIDENGIEYIPNDYYISDMSNTTIVIPVLTSSSIRVIPPDGPDTSSDDYCIDGTLQNLSDDVAEYERFATITVTGGQVSFVGEFYLP